MIVQYISAVHKKGDIFSDSKEEEKGIGKVSRGNFPIDFLKTIFFAHFNIKTLSTVEKY